MKGSEGGEGLFYRLIRLGGEDALTELLAALLRVSALSEAFLAEVLGLEIPDAPVEVNTQVQDPQTKARPDLVLSAPELTLWVEAKLWADLTDKQPGTYIEVLHRDHPKEGRLVVLAPSSRRGKLSRRLRERVGAEMGDASDHEPTFTHQGIPVTLITWRDVRECFHQCELDDPVMAYLLREFVGVIDQHVEGVTFPLSPEMLPMLHDPDVLRAVAALEDLLTSLWEELKGRGYKTRNQDPGDLRQTGFCAWPKGRKGLTLWIGQIARAGVIWPGKGPVWVWLYGKDLEEAAEERLKAAGVELIEAEGKLPDWADCALVPLRFEGASPEEIVEGVCRQLELVWSVAGG